MVPKTPDTPDWRKASSFSTADDAAGCLTMALRHLDDEVADFLTASEPTYLVLEGEAPRPIGIVATADGRAEETATFRFILTRDPEEQAGYRATTGFPRRPTARGGFGTLTTPLGHLIGAYFHEDANEEYESWQLALAQMQLDAPRLYAALPAEIDRALKTKSDADLEQLLIDLDFGFSLSATPREILEMFAQQLSTIDQVNSSLVWPPSPGSANG